MSNNQDRAELPVMSDERRSYNRAFPGAVPPWDEHRWEGWQARAALAATAAQEGHKRMQRTTSRLQKQIVDLKSSRDHWMGEASKAKKAATAAPAVPEGHIAVPVQVLKDASDALGHFVSDEGWASDDMQAMDNLDAYLAPPKIQAMLAAAPTPEAQAAGQATAEGAAVAALKRLQRFDFECRRDGIEPLPAGVVKIIDIALAASPDVQPKGTTAERLLAQVRETCAASLRAGPGVAVTLPAELAEEGRKFMRGEASLIEQLPFADVQKLGDVLNETPAAQAPAPGDDGDLLTIAYMSGAHDAKRSLNLNDPAVQKRLAAQWGFVQATPASDEPLFLLHCGQIDSSGEQDDWDTEADSGKRVEEFCRLHPGQTVKLYPHVQSPGAEPAQPKTIADLDKIERDVCGSIFTIEFNSIKRDLQHPDYFELVKDSAAKAIRAAVKQAVALTAREVADPVWPYAKELVVASAEQQADQAPAVTHAPLPKGWTFNHARPIAGEDGVWAIGFLDHEDDHFSPIVTVDTGEYYQPQQAQPLAEAILARLMISDVPVQGTKEQP